MARLVVRATAIHTCGVMANREQVETDRWRALHRHGRPPGQARAQAPAGHPRLAVPISARGVDGGPAAVMTIGATTCLSQPTCGVLWRSNAASPARRTGSALRPYRRRS